MASQISTNMNNEGEKDFNFDEWINDNELNEVKQLLIEHKAMNVSSLTLQSNEFQSLMTDPRLFTKAHMIPKILNAVHKIQIFKIVIDPKEQKVIDLIQNNLNILSKMEMDLTSSNDEYPKTMQRIKDDKVNKIKAVKIKINKIFDDLCQCLNERRKILLKQVEDIKNEKGNDELGDEKESDIIKICTEKINISRTFLRAKESKYEQLTSSNENRMGRKDEISEIGENVKKQFTETQNVLNKNIDIIKQRINENNELIVNIDLITKKNAFDLMIQKMNKFGKIINETYNSSNPRQSDVDFEEDEQDLMIKKSQKELEQKNNEYAVLQSKWAMKEEKEKAQDLMIKKLQKELKQKNNECTVLQSKWAMKEEKEKENEEKLQFNEYVAKWSSNHKGNGIVLQENYTKAIGPYNKSVRCVNPIQKGMIVKLKYTIFIDKMQTHNDANSIVVVSHKHGQFAKLSTPWYRGLEMDAYGIDIGRPGTIYEPHVNNAHKNSAKTDWGIPKFETDKEVIMFMLVDFINYETCCLSFYDWNMKLMAPPNQKYSMKLPVRECWYPAVGLYNSKAWCKIETVH